MMQATHWIAVAAGGALGAILRAFIYELFVLTRNPHLHHYPTLTVNLVGSIIMGGCWYLVVEKAMLPPTWKIFVMTGFLGALTTFSTFSLDLMRLLHSDQFLTALVYGVSSVLVCLLGTWLGYQGIRWAL
ncbi:MAG: fluoride efflux transporter CrcB [Endozoicomonas sp.]